MSKYWQDRPHSDDHIAYHCLDSGGYIPYAPYGGLYVMDDFGNLVQSLPMHHYEDQASVPNICWQCEPFFAR